jgi:putative ABC transport system ATP-binding protein
MIVELKEITKTYNTGQPDELTPIKDFSMSVSKGEIVLLTGPSGSGKSTLLSMIAGISKPTSGDITVCDEKIAKLSEKFASKYRREKIGMIFQSYNLLETMTTIDNVMAPLFPRKMKASEMHEKAIQLLKSLNMESKANNTISSLSGGERQRTAIARALISNPEIILADEPTANLDSRLASQFIDILLNLSDKGHTILIATHDPKIIDSPLNKRAIEIGGENLQ